MVSSPPPPSSVAPAVEPPMMMSPWPEPITLWTLTKVLPSLPLPSSRLIVTPPAASPKLTVLLPVPPRTVVLAALTTITSSPSPPSSVRSEEHTSELQSLMRISYAVFCLKKKTHNTQYLNHVTTCAYINIFYYVNL